MSYVTEEMTIISGPQSMLCKRQNNANQNKRHVCNPFVAHCKQSFALSRCSRLAVSGAAARARLGTAVRAAQWAAT